MAPFWYVYEIGQACTDPASMYVVIHAVNTIYICIPLYYCSIWGIQSRRVGTAILFSHAICEGGACAMCNNMRIGIMPHFEYAKWSGFTYIGTIINSTRWKKDKCLASCRNVSKSVRPWQWVFEKLGGKCHIRFPLYDGTRPYTFFLKLQLSAKKCWYNSVWWNAFSNLAGQRAEILVARCPLPKYDNTPPK